jgi:hypothetical protein
VSRKVIFQKLCATGGNIVQLIPFVHVFYAFQSPLFYNHRNHESDFIVVPFTMGTFQGNPLGRALFTLARFRALRSRANHFLSYLFPSITNDTHIIGPPFIISFAYEHFQTKLHAIGFSIQPHKCVAWSPSGLQHVSVYYPIKRN